MSVYNHHSNSIYQAAHRQAVMADRSQLGMLKITGETRLDLINRMSTQAVKTLAPGTGAATVLVTDIARIIDRLIIYADEEAVYAVAGESNADQVARHLMRFVFFQDDFHIEDLSADRAVFGVYGPRSSEMLAAAGFPEVDFPRHHWRRAAIAGGTDVTLHRTDPIAGDGYFVICQQKDKSTVQHHLAKAGLMMADEADFEHLRVESGLPRIGHELALDYIPLEADLWQDVSFDKGCYVGQEIIARMESRGRLAKRLVRLILGGPAKTGDSIAAKGKTVGTLTSVADGPGGRVALGFVKTAALEQEVPLIVNDAAVEKYAWD